MQHFDLFGECRKLLVEFDSIDTDVDSILYRPWMDDEKKFRLGFDPKPIAANAMALANERGSNGLADLKFLIRLGAELGSDLDAIASALAPDRANRFRRLSAAYGLVSRPSPRRFSTEVTLSRLCLALPALTCWYLHKRVAARPQRRRRRPGAASAEAMAAVVPDYPPAMMAYAFAFLVPDRDRAYCRLLMKAHMLHEYEAHGPCVNTDNCVGGRDDDDHKDKVIVHVVKRTLAAMAASSVSYDAQIRFLTRTGLVRATAVGGRSDDAAGGTAVAAEGETVDEEEMVVAEHVAAAALAWEKKDSKNYTEHFITYYRPLKTDII